MVVCGWLHFRPPKTARLSENNGTRLSLVLTAQQVFPVVALMGAAANEIFISTVLATGFSTLAAIVAVKTLERMSYFSIKKEKNDD